MARGVLHPWALRTSFVTLPALLLLATLPASEAFADTVARPISLVPPASTLSEPNPAGNEKIWSAVGVAGVYALATTWVYVHYYLDEPNAFRFESDGWFGADTYAGGADKLGHFWGNMALTRGASEILVGGGWDPVLADLMAVTLTATLYTWSEVEDGYYGWGMSSADLIVNLLGDGFGILMRRCRPLDEVFDVRISYFPSSQYRQKWAERGFINAGEDYNGQTVHLALHLKALPFVRAEPSLAWLQYFDLTIGYRAMDYEPEGENPRQEILFGVALNFQHVLRGVRGPLGSGLRFAAEVFTPPFTAIDTVAAQRARPTPKE